MALFNAPELSRDEALASAWAAIGTGPLPCADLPRSHRQQLLESLRALDQRQLSALRQALSRTPSRNPFQPLTEALSAETPLLSEIGRDRLRQSRIAILLLAGGEGSRLHSTYPKGAFPLSPVLRRSPLQIICERIAAAQARYDSEFPLAVMVSKGNRKAIEAHIRQHRHWGLKPNNVLLFDQGQLPVINARGDPVIEAHGHLKWAPHGNGGVFHHLFSDVIAERLRSWKIETLSVLPIDNPLADPLSAPLIGGLSIDARAPADVCFKAIKQRHNLEKVGIFGRENVQLIVREYSERPITGEHQPELALANTGEFTISWTFAERLSRIPLTEWPLHIAKKSLKGREICKGEYFNFDLLRWAERPQVLEFDRNTSFAPLKEAEGERGPEAVRAAMHRAERELYERISQKPAPNHLFELRASWYYSDRDFERLWQRLPTPNTSAF